MQESNPGLLQYRQILYQLSYKGSPADSYCLTILKVRSLRSRLVTLKHTRENLFHASLLASSGLLVIFGASLFSSSHGALSVCACVQIL